MIKSSRTLETQSPYDYHATRRKAEARLRSLPMDAILAEAFPDMWDWGWSGRDLDLAGSDCFVELPDQRVEVDAKLGTRDPSASPMPTLPIETWSDVLRGSPGWPFRRNSKTDKVLWVYKDTQNWILMDFSELQRVLRTHLGTVRTASSSGYNVTRKDDRIIVSEYLRVPLALLFQLLDDVQMSIELRHALPRDIFSPISNQNRKEACEAKFKPPLSLRR